MLYDLCVCAYMCVLFILLSFLSSTRKSVFFTATTGVASLILDKKKGMTLHSFLGCGDLHLPPYKLKEFLTTKETYHNVYQRLLMADVIGIDEVSMLSSYVLTVFHQLAQHVRNNTKPFGGIQVNARFLPPR